MLNIVAILSACLLLASPASDRYRQWHLAHELVWEDFQGTPDSTSRMEAFTYTTLELNWECVHGQFSFEVEAKFDRSRSWCKPLLTDALLAHEQLHFDITELYARKMRAYFAEQVDPCAMSRADVQAAIDRFQNGWQECQATYDAETHHSRDQTAQARWRQKVAAELVRLRAYALL